MSNKIKSRPDELNNQELETIINELRSDFNGINLKVDGLTENLSEVITEFGKLVDLMKEWKEKARL